MWITGFKRLAVQCARLSRFFVCLKACDLLGSCELRKLLAGHEHHLPVFAPLHL